MKITENYEPKIGDKLHKDIPIIISQISNRELVRIEEYFKTDNNYYLSVYLLADNSTLLYYFNNYYKCEVMDKDFRRRGYKLINDAEI